MKIVFKKDEDSNISVLQKLGDEESEFSYVDMIKSLLETKELDEPEMSDGFTDAEQKSIRSMVRFINEKLASIAMEDSK